jgi:hypothetical protein
MPLNLLHELVAIPAVVAVVVLQLFSGAAAPGGVTAAAAASGIVAAAAAAPRRVGDAWGTNIHWTAESAPGEAAMMAKAFKLARMDFQWSVIEKVKGQYDFGAYDGLLGVMKSHGIRPYWILDYGNPLYPYIRPRTGPNCTTRESCNATCEMAWPMGTCDDGAYYCCGAPGCNGHHTCANNPNVGGCYCDHKIKGNNGCNSPECIAAFGNFAQAAVNHFKGNRIIFECINEPNGMGGDSAIDLAALCMSAGKAFTAAGELFVGPTTAGMDWKYLNTTMANGILDAFGAVSVHPYRQRAPDTVLADWLRLREMINHYGTTAAQKAMPMLSGEWGYTTAGPPCAYGNRVTEVQQAAYLARMWLSNTLAGAAVSINYDWPDGSDPTSCESNFGAIHFKKTGDKNQPYLPKPKYISALALQNGLGNFQRVGGRVVPSLIKPSSVRAADVFVLRFENSSDVADTDDPQVTSGGTASAVGFAAWSNDTMVGGEIVYTETHITFSAAPAAASECWRVTDMFGEALATTPHICATAGAVVSIGLPANGNATGPIYLLPTVGKQDNSSLAVSLKLDDGEGRSTAALAVAKLPVLNWPGARSDWLDVSSGECGGHKAVGNGKTDDTAAIQACLNMLNYESANATRLYVTVYIPPGTFRITKTLLVVKILGGAVIGHGEATILQWAGEKGGKMMEDGGVTRTRFVGIVFDGQGIAGVGFEHDGRRPGLYETRIRHQVNKFTNFLTAGLRVGYNKTGGGKLESSEMLFENCIFDKCGRDTPACAPRQKSAASPAHDGSPGTIGCGGVVLLHFNDYDNTFDGCLFADNQFGIYTAEMANFYVHNSRFERSKSHDMYLAPASGNGIRRCTSQGSGKFVGSWSGPFTSGVSVQDCRVDGWTSPGSAIDYELRGPLLLLDNQFTNAPDKSPPVSMIPYADSVTAVSFSNNLVSGKHAVQALLLNVTANVRVFALPRPAPNHAAATPITPTTNFLRKTWSVPQKVFDVVTFGGACGNGSCYDDAAITKTIAAAKAAGNGALAYFPPGNFKVNNTVHIQGGGYTVGGSGCRSVIQWGALSADRKRSLLPTDAVVVVSKAQGVLVEQIAMKTNYDTEKTGTNVTKLLHLGGGDDSDRVSAASMAPHVNESFPPLAKGVSALYDGIYGATSNIWNASETKVSNLSVGEKVQIIHMDGNLHLDNAAAGTVLVGFLIQGTIHVSGEVRHPATSKELPIGVLTMVGLVVDWDVWVEDDQSLVIVDLYNEQLKAGHLYLDSSRVAAVQPDITKRSSGRVSILGAKMNTVGRLLNATDYYGSLMYATGMWFEEKMPTWIVKQTGATPMNITLLGNAIWGDNSSALTLDLDTGAASRVSILGTLLLDYGSTAIPIGQTKFLKDVTTAETPSTTMAHLDDFRTLGTMDLAWNYPAIKSGDVAHHHALT